MNADDVLRVVMDRLGGGMPVVDITTELAGVLVDLSGRADFLTDTFTIETVAGQAAYDEPENLKSVYAVSIDGGAVLEKKAYRDYLQYLQDNATALPGTPGYYALRHGKLYVWPVPDAAVSITIDAAVTHPDVFTDILFGATFHEAVYEGTLAAVYAGKLNRLLTLEQRTIGQQEALIEKFYQDHPQAKRHKERYEAEIETLINNMEVEPVVVEYKDL